MKAFGSRRAQRYIAAGTPPGVPRGATGAWNFDENADTTSEDISGNGNTATWVGTPAWVPGYTGSAVDIRDTPARYMTTPIDEYISATAYSLAVRIKPDAQAGAYRILLAQDFYTLPVENSKRNHQLRLTEGGEFNFLRFNSSNGVIESLVTTQKVTAGVWTHIAATFDTTNGSVIYINGSSVLTSSVTTANNAQQTGRGLQIGYSLVSTGELQFTADGALDDAAVANVSWTAQEVADMAL